jgi:hypothetical protein
MLTTLPDAESTAALLDERILDAIHRWHIRGESIDDAAFNALALDIFRYQARNCAPYGRFATARGFSPANPPRDWREIPAVPSSAFKELALAPFDVSTAERAFRTSGTTAQSSGWHYLQRAYLYDESLLAGFDRFMLSDGASLRYLNIVPNPRTNKHSSLGYMMGHVSVLRGDGKAGWFFEDDRVDVDAFRSALERAIADGQPVCIAGTAFAFAALLMTLAQEAVHLHAPPGSRIMETGGFKGRAQRVDRGELYARLEHAFGIPQHMIVAEYGMTELCSQYYDTIDSRTSEKRVKAGPPWLRCLVVDDAGNPLPDGETGYLRHVDLANRSSIVAIDTEDRGYVSGDGFVLLGRDDNAPPRGCSLDAEDLLAGR